MCERIDDTGDTAIKMSTDRELFFHCFFSIFCVHLAPDDVYIISECISLSVNINQHSFTRINNVNGVNYLKQCFHLLKLIQVC